MTLAIVVLTLVTLQRLGELVLARRNTRRLLDRGGRESAPEHYPLLVGLHATWLLGLWILAPGQPATLGWLGVFLVLQLLRAWVLVTLGERWTTRIITLPGEPLVRRGPYRFLSHPNYVVVAGEIAVLPLAFDLPGYALAFSLLNAGVLFVRIRAEERALAGSAADAHLSPTRARRR
jgi:methyltransferase